MTDLASPELDQYGIPVKEEKKKKGCFYYGCITSIVLLVIIFLLGVWGWQKLTGAVVEAVMPYTDSQPRTLPTVNVDPAEYEAVSAKIADFEAALDSNMQAELILNSAEINSMIASDEQLKPLRNHLFVGIEGNDIVGEVAVPLDDIPMLNGLEGRYLNGFARFEVSLKEGILFVNIENLEVKGEPLPDDIMGQLRNQNLGKELYENEESVKYIKQFESIEVRDGQLIIRARGELQPPQ
ncbi:hypothetical protein OAO01_02440 [Oligoflexia bacterium]|nr:hypothetical protein [Oligoflexia bacterium]